MDGPDSISKMGGPESGLWTEKLNCLSNEMIFAVHGSLIIDEMGRGFSVNLTSNTVSKLINLQIYMSNQIT